MYTEVLPTPTPRIRFSLLYFVEINYVLLFIFQSSTGFAGTKTKRLCLQTLLLYFRFAHTNQFAVSYNNSFVERIDNTN